MQFLMYRINNQFQLISDTATCISWPIFGAIMKYLSQDNNLILLLFGHVVTGYFFIAVCWLWSTIPEARRAKPRGEGVENQSLASGRGIFGKCRTVGRTWPSCVSSSKTSDAKSYSRRGEPGGKV